MTKVSDVLVLRTVVNSFNLYEDPQPFYGPFFRDHPGQPVPEENS